MTNHQLPLDGILIVDKPADWTSHDVVAKVRKICQTKRVGHTGTLDPFATGVLVICLNRATRLVQFLTGEDKEYLATIRFGFATDTGDLTGTPLTEPAATDHLTPALIEAALKSFRGHLQQIPPMYSAKKIGGVKLYEMARRGEEIERQPITVEIKELELLGQIPGDGLFTIRVVSSAGTYIRTLAEDIGKRLGIGAHLQSLRRTRVGNCVLSEAVTLDQLAEISIAGKLSDVLIPMAKSLLLPEVQINETEKGLVQHGRAVQRDGQWLSGEKLKLVNNDELIAIAEFNAATKILQPKVVIA